MSGRIHAHAGFTLVELLVCISIIALLISLLMPALGSARKIARQTTCLNHIRQVGIYNTMYLDAAKDYLPAFATALDNDVYGSGSIYSVTWVTRMVRVGIMNKLEVDNPAWPQELHSSARDARLCPSLDKSRITAAYLTSAHAGEVLADYASLASIFGAYDPTNQWSTSEIPAGSTNQWRKITSILKPSAVMGFADAPGSGLSMQSSASNRRIAQFARIGSSSTNPAQNYRWRLGAEYVGNSSYINPADSMAAPFRHGTNTNFSFLDGHAESRKYNASNVGGWGRIHYVDP